MINGLDVTFQQYAYRAIRAAVPAGVAVETKPRENGAIPYVFVGPTDVREHPAGWAVFITVEVHSKREGSNECKQLQNAIRNALHFTEASRVTETNPDSEAFPAPHTGVWHFIGLDEDSARCAFEVARSTWRGTQRFRLLIEELPG